ncbi:MAG: chemotaxis protein CheA [Spirochaetales bacterium]|nr:chemotaxis protein CheA [Spirochaetales bacterium]
MENVLHDIFIQEADENLQVLESLIIYIEENPDDNTKINDAFRAMHSIKGGAGLAGFTHMKDFTHIVEDLFESIRNGSIKIEKEVISVILNSMDIIRVMLENIKNNESPEKGVNTKNLEETINNMLLKENEKKIDDSEVKIEKKVDEDIYYIKLHYFSNIFLVGIDPLMFISDLKKIGQIIDIYQYFTEDYDPEDFDPEKFYMSWKLFFSTNKSIAELKDIFCFVIDESELEFVNLSDILDQKELISKYTINNKTILDYNIVKNETTNTTESDLVKTPIITESSYIRVPTEKLEMIFNTVSELLISQARLNTLVEEYSDIIPDSLETVTDALRNQNKLLQEQVTSLRMMNLGSTFDRFKRVVRDMANDMGKKIKLELSGHDTELDKNMIEKLNDPMKHLVRNCIDHGIETAEERINAGKPEEGLLKLSAYLESGKVVIEVSDDGKGINREKLIAKAIERKIITPETKLTDLEILSLIFHPGFSTAEVVTDISGRGVGMDVVKSTINELHGTIDLASIEGEGTTFKLNLPLTLAILDGMLTSVGEEKYIIPTLSILEIFKAEKKDLKTISGGKEVVLFRGSYIPLLRLHSVFNIPQYINDPAEGQIIVVNAAGLKVAILVDYVLEQYQVVLKSLQKNFSKVDHITSATILGDGTVALIVDIPSLINA